MKKAAIIALFFAAFITQSSAQPENLRGGMLDIVRELLNFREDADLTDKQRDHIKDVIASHKSEIEAQFQAGRNARRSMQESVAAAGPESARTQNAADAVAAAARSRALLVAKIASEIRPILTADQLELAEATRERIDEIIERRMSQFAG
jgi:Spy/CpxP family protein refolding chaperone